MVAPVARVVRIPQRMRSRADEARACIILSYVSWLYVQLAVVSSEGGGRTQDHVKNASTTIHDAISG